MMALTDQINQRLRELWLIEPKPEDHSKLLKAWPLQYPDFKKNALVFVGLNPSLTGSTKNKDLNEEDREFRDSVSNLDQLEVELVNKEIYNLLREVESRAYYGDKNAKDEEKRKPYRYYRPIKEIADRLNEKNWLPLDLFAVRKTEQKDILKNLKTGKGRNRIWSKFAKEQLGIFKDALMGINPKAVVVINAEASRIVLQCNKEYKIDDFLKLEFVPEKFCYYIVNGSRPIPLFFSGSISGQGNIDKFSIERLTWHIKYVMGYEKQTTSICEKLNKSGTNFTE